MKMRGGNTLLVATAGLALLGGDQVPTTPTQPPAHEIVMPNIHGNMALAAKARQEIAARYTSCGVTEVLDFQNTDPQPGIQQDKPRDRVKIKVKVRQSAAALAAMQTYDHDSTVAWTQPDLFVRERTETQHGEQALGKEIITGHTQTAGKGNLTSTEAYPYASRKPGDRLGVYAQQFVETNDFAGKKHYTNTHVFYCGTIMLKAAGDGENRWQIDPYAAPVDDIEIDRACDLIEDPQQPGLFNEQC
jgi:hypothetical protein